MTFPMLPDARVGAKGESPDGGLMRDLAAVFEDARRMLAQRLSQRSQPSVIEDDSMSKTETKSRVRRGASPVTAARRPR